MTNQYKKFWQNSLWVVVILFCVRCIAAKSLESSSFLPYDLYGYAGEAIGTTVILMIFYEKSVWKWKHNPLKSIPVLSKTYSGFLKSSYDGKKRDVKLTIKQSLLSISVIMETSESTSKSISASIAETQNVWQLTYTYLNVPNAEVRNRSEIHYGTAVLNIENPSTIKGQYYTDRKTIGDIKLDAEN